ncbi:putative reverse transcriptase domain-containing protein, partial [Tanacetum coccineum]
NARSVVVCYECGERGHKSNACPKKADRQCENVRVQAYVIRDAEHNQGPNVVTGSSQYVQPSTDGFVDSLPVAVCSGIANFFLPFRHGELITIFGAVVKQSLDELRSCSRICDALACLCLSSETLGLQRVDMGCVSEGYVWVRGCGLYQWVSASTTFRGLVQRMMVHLPYQVRVQLVQRVLIDKCSLMTVQPETGLAPLGGLVTGYNLFHSDHIRSATCSAASTSHHAKPEKMKETTKPPLILLIYQLLYSKAELFIDILSAYSFRDGLRESVSHLPILTDSIILILILSSLAEVGPCQFSAADMLRQSEPKKMAPESSQAMVILKFDMHIHTSTLTTKELKHYYRFLYSYGLASLPSHTDTDVRDDFPTNYNEVGDDQLSRMTKDPNGQGNKYDKVLSSVGVNLCVLSYPCFFLPSYSAYHGRLLKASLVARDRYEACWGGKFSSSSKKRACKANKAVGSESEEIVSVTLIRQANLKPFSEAITSHPKGIAGATATRSRLTDVGKEVVDLSENTRIPTTPPVHTTQEEQFEHGNTQLIRFTACKELISHLATPAEDEAELLKRHEQLNRDHVDMCNHSETQLEELGRLQTGLQREMQTNDGQSKKLALLENAHSQCSDRERELMDSLKDIENERDDWRKTALNQERVRMLEKEKIELVAELAQAEVVRHKVIREFNPAIVSRLHSSVEYRKSLVVPIWLCFTAGWLGSLGLGRKEEEIAAMLANTSDFDIEGSNAWKDKHREHFTKQYPYVQKVADSYRLSLDELMKIPLDVPSPEDDQGGPSVQNVDGGSTNQTLEDAPLA